MPNKTHDLETNPLIGKVIAIDGPAGAGKGTLAKAIAKYYRVKYLDTGTLYRMVAMRVLKAGGNPAVESDAIQACGFKEFDFRHVGDNKFSVFVDGEAIMDELRKPEVGAGASKVAFFTSVRQSLLELQQEYAVSWAKKIGVILDGRDIGTVICPQADFKIFLDASPEIRAKRRVAEIKERGFKANYQECLSEILERDARDRGREDAPLRPADNAIMIDSSNLSEEEVFQKVSAIINAPQSSVDK